MSGSAGKPKRILYLSDLLGGCAWYRCHAPGMALQRLGHEVRLQDTLEFEDIDWCDVLIVQRIGETKLARAFEYARSRDKLTVYDLDDDLWSLASTNQVKEYWSQERLGGLATVLRAADRVTTSTQPLALLLGAYCSDVRVIPNMLPQEDWPSVGKDFDHAAPIVVGWAGGVSHYQDLKEVADVLGQLLDRHPGIEVHLAGAEEEWVAPHERLKYLESVRLEEYAGLLSGFDIAIAPLCDNRFNASKSDLKVLEYSMIGLPAVASKVPAYSASVRHGETGFLARNAKDWLKHLSALVEDAELRARMGSAARAWAQTRTVEGNISLWERAYDISE